jgi:hypothetical protein
LLQKCTELILSPSALSALVSALEKNRNLLFLEDFVARQGLDWGFAEHVVETARQHAKLFDELVNHTRYE